MDTSPPSSTIPLATQVGGHPGVLTTEDGSLLIKPAHPVEHKFYQSLLTDPVLEPLLPFVPKFYGTLKLEGQIDPTSQGDPGGDKITVAPVVDEDVKDDLPMDVLTSRPFFPNAQSLVLENLSYPFSKPNILDIKLGTVLYDDSASPEKRERMEHSARATTSFETGVRLTGFQVYNNTTSEIIRTPKAYGNSIKPSDLPDGIARFFPVAPADASVLLSTGLPAKILFPILQSLREDVAEIREILSGLHLRMVGGSLLVVYEADWARAEEGTKKFLSGNDDNNGGDEEEEDEEEDSDDEDEGKVKMPYIVKLIDFAHTKLVPGAGPEEGVLLGLDTVLRLLDRRIEEIKSMIT